MFGKKMFGFGGEAAPKSSEPGAADKMFETGATEMLVSVLEPKVREHLLKLKYIEEGQVTSSYLDDVIDELVEMRKKMPEADVESDEMIAEVIKELKPAHGYYE